MWNNKSDRYPIPTRNLTGTGMNFYPWVCRLFTDGRVIALPDPNLIRCHPYSVLLSGLFDRGVLWCILIQFIYGKNLFSFLKTRSGVVSLTRARGRLFAHPSDASVVTVMANESIWRWDEVDEPLYVQLHWLICRREPTYQPLLLHIQYCRIHAHKSYPSFLLLPVSVCDQARLHHSLCPASSLSTLLASSLSIIKQLWTGMC
jgi:hypothetical protein